MKKRLLYPILLLQACMPEENLPLQEAEDTPGYFIECYCVPGKNLALCATSVVPASENLTIRFSYNLDVSIRADHEIQLQPTLYSEPGSDFIYNYVSNTTFQPYGADSLYLSILTEDGKSITASTFVPSAVSLYQCTQEGQHILVQFYTSRMSGENYYICTAEAVSKDELLGKATCFLDFSEYPHGKIVEKTMVLPEAPQADKIICILKRITRENYDYQISLHAANTANQSSITTPVPLKGNLNGALGIFTCYSEDRAEIRNFSAENTP